MVGKAPWDHPPKIRLSALSDVGSPPLAGGWRSGGDGEDPIRTPPKIVWSIAGFDPSSGAGITADLMTFAAHGLFGCSAITALTVQSTLGVPTSEPVRPELLAQTLEHLAADLPPAGIKLGLLGSPETAAVIARFLRDDEGEVTVVLDPVLRSSSGRELYPASAVQELHRTLLPLVDWITPNWTELAALAESPVATIREARAAMQALTTRHPGLNVVATGGDQSTPTDLVLLADGRFEEVRGEHVATLSTHGTGCAFSSALLAQLVMGSSGASAVQAAKDFVAGALRDAPGLGHGNGPHGIALAADRQTSGSPRLHVEAAGAL